MPIDRERVRRCLKEFDFGRLFIEELGWDRHPNRLEVQVDGRTFALSAVAQKRGMVAFTLSAAAGENLPGYPLRRKIERQVERSAHEHLIVFTDAEHTTQIWQWVKREAGKPNACREYPYHRGHSGEALAQKLAAISFALAEEESLTLIKVAGSVRAAFDVDRVTKRFYDRFKSEHEAFLKFIKGIPAAADREWYASLMLNRLMFVYFIQKKEFLDGDPHYLRNRLAMIRQLQGKDKFLTFYRHFLLRLFHEGLGSQQRNTELDRLLGKVPFLNGGLFDVHQLEHDNAEITIPDKAFEKLFDFFDAYQWHLDERPLRADNEINPDVLGYIFEKYINQKQMGAYYTKEDITGYISKNTIIPYLFDAAEKKCAIAFRSGSALWRLLPEDPDRYLYPAMRKGVIDDQGEVVPLPKEIAAGVKDVAKRDGWNRPARPEFALPTETWREHVARRTRCLEIREKLHKGEIHQINDLVTYNLDIRQFAQDAIENCEGPELLRAFYHVIAGRVPERSNEKYEPGVSVLDPTCGSGAFLFAALNILEPLYEACLDRMESFVEDLERSGDKGDPKKFADFRKLLARVTEHPNDRYFILKSIIIGNLYGVDIMEEAVEICKLRLFLKLVAQVDRVEHIEPLPDIDFNIRAGNTLVGFTSLAEVRRAMTHDARGNMRIVTSEDELALVDIEESADIADRAFQKFHEMQTQHGMVASEFADAKGELRQRLRALGEKLDAYLAGEYAIDARNAKTFDPWRLSHQPFHWIAEFYGIMVGGGFGVVIGNPPYVEYSKVRHAYQVVGFDTRQCGNLYAFCIERSYRILRQSGRFGFIVQAPIVSTQRMALVRNQIRTQSSTAWFSTYDDRPSKLFDGMHHCRLAIVLACISHNPTAPNILTTRYHKWYTEERPQLFEIICYLELPAPSAADVVPKFRSTCELNALQKIDSGCTRLGAMKSASPTNNRIYYKITGVGHWFAFTLVPPRFWRNGKEGSSTRESNVSFSSAKRRDVAFSCLWSSLHYWLYQAMTNCRDFNPSDLESVPIPKSAVNGDAELQRLAAKIMDTLERTSDVSAATYTVGGTVSYQKFRPKAAKSLFDDVDGVLAGAFKFTHGESDFIINYDIKYRMGQGAEENDE